MNSFSQVQGELRSGTHLYLLAGGGLNKGAEVPASTSVLRESCPAATLLEPRMNEFVSQQVHVQAPQGEHLRLQ